MATARLADLDLLVPDCRGRVLALVSACRAKGIPLEVFETGRAPLRQGELYARGRNPHEADFGRTVTRAHPWGSLHQWGLAADLVFRINGMWTWEEPRPGMWARMHALAAAYGLHILRDQDGRVIEMPHVQVGTTADLNQLERGPNDTAAWLVWLRARAVGTLPLPADPEDRE
jgi:D-alanyl-D-alanine carboxypeptidase